jgi:hypothetical protein
VAPLRLAPHVHSDWSYDGTFGLREIALAFARRRYDAVLMAEHDRGFDAERWDAYRAACAEASAGGALLVPGIEYSDAANAIHVPVWGEIPFLGEGLGTGDLLVRAAEAGGVAVLAHPGRREAWRRFDPAWAPRLLGIELWNRKYDGYAPSPAATRLLQEQTDLVPFVGLDFHTARQFHPLAMAIEPDGPLTPAGVYEALRRRRCRPMAYRLPAAELCRGPAMHTMRGAEWARRRVARRLRRPRARVSGSSSRP